MLCWTRRRAVRQIAVMYLYFQQVTIKTMVILTCVILPTVRHDYRYTSTSKKGYTAAPPNERSGAHALLCSEAVCAAAASRACVIVLMHAHVELMHAQALTCTRTHTPQVLPVHMYGGHGLEGFAQTTILNLEGQLSHRPAPSAIADFNSAAMLFFFFRCRE